MRRAGRARRIGYPFGLLERHLLGVAAGGVGAVQLHLEPALLRDQHGAGLAALKRADDAPRLELVDQAGGSGVAELALALPPASITKVMTMLLLAEAIDGGKVSLSDPVVCTAHAASMGGSQIWLKEGETMTVDELLRAVAVGSANDAACALADFLAGSEEAFVEEMNEHAAALGCTHTHFCNCTGLDAEGHVSSARDIAAMSQALLSHPMIRDYTTIWQDTLRGGETQLVNTNKLVRWYKGTTGLKTGTTDDAKYCLAASAARDGMELIAVILGAPTGNDRFGAARGLLDYGFAGWRLIDTPLPEITERIPVSGGVAREVAVRAEAPEQLLVARDIGEIKPKLRLSERVSAPVKAGDPLGEGDLSSEGVVLCRFAVTAAEDVDEMTVSRAFALCFRSILLMRRQISESG